ncbi:uncharacterized protein LOC122232049 [Panthera tigris]|uniref:uncharacterized protein LOC122232049 n=1 Tax=Panthera tigris TaxID=9694 RepID=UPI001C6F7F3F|nr:uncharacterized protein LOC122232049 [Panthera tigris]
MALAAVRTLQELVLITAITPPPPWPVTISRPLCHRHHHHLCHHNHLPSPLSLGHQWNHGGRSGLSGAHPLSSACPVVAVELWKGPGDSRGAVVAPLAPWPAPPTPLRGLVRGAEAARPGSEAARSSRHLNKNSFRAGNRFPRRNAPSADPNRPGGSDPASLPESKTSSAPGEAPRDEAQRNTARSRIFPEPACLVLPKNSGGRPEQQTAEGGPRPPHPGWKPASVPGGLLGFPSPDTSLTSLDIFCVITSTWH